MRIEVVDGELEHPSGAVLRRPALRRRRLGLDPDARGGDIAHEVRPPRGKGREDRVTVGLQLRLADEGRGGLSRVRRRRAIQQLEADLERARVNLADVTERHVSVGASLVGLPDRRELAALLDRRGELDAQLRREAAARVCGFRSAPPCYLTTALGSLPTEALARERWERTAVEVEHHRLRWQVTDPMNAIGGRTGDRRLQQACSALGDEIERTVEDLRRHREPQRWRGLVR